MHCITAIILKYHTFFEEDDFLLPLSPLSLSRRGDLDRDRPRFLEPPPLLPPLDFSPILDALGVL
jgi:hypothetical protein